MSKKHSKPVSEPSANQMVLTPADFEQMFRDSAIDRAIEKTTQWFSKCPGPCFPHVYRWWDS